MRGRRRVQDIDPHPDAPMEDLAPPSVPDLLAPPVAQARDPFLALDHECGTCQGNGIVTTPAWLAWRQRELAAEAAWKATHPGQSWYASAECEEIGQDEPEDPEIDCKACDSSGYVPTQSGRELLHFLQRHAKTWQL